MAETSSGKSFNPFGSVFTVLGILMGAASLISLVQRWTGIEIVAEVARDALSLYRQMMDQFHWALFSWWTPLELPWGAAFSMPAWGMDLLTVWVFSIGALLRVDAMAKYARMPQGVNWYIVQYLWVFFAPYVVVWWLLTLLMSLPEAFTREGAKREMYWALYIRLYTLAAVGSPIVLGVLFFIWNAIQISPQ